MFFHMKFCFIVLLCFFSHNKVLRKKIDLIILPRNFYVTRENKRRENLIYNLTKLVVPVDYNVKAKWLWVYPLKKWELKQLLFL